MQFHSEVKLSWVLQIKLFTWQTFIEHLWQADTVEDCAYSFYNVKTLTLLLWFFLSSLVQTRFPFIQWCLYFYTQTVYKTYPIFLIWKTKIETSFFMKTCSPHSLNSLLTLTTQIFGLVICLLTRIRISLHWKMAIGMEIFKKGVPQEWRDKEAENRGILGQGNFCIIL